MLATSYSLAGCSSQGPSWLRTTGFDVMAQHRRKPLRPSLELGMKWWGDVTMIGAMPAVAVRHERKRQDRQDKKKPRPHHLYLGHNRDKHSSPPKGSSPCQSRAGTPSPSLANSPVQSPAATLEEYEEEPQDYYLCRKVNILYVVVIVLLLGGIVLIVGLVQLKPGSNANANRYYIIASGCLLLLIGFILITLRCCILPWRFRRMQRLRKEESAISTVSIGVSNDTSLVTNGKGGQNGQACRKESDSTLIDGSTLHTDTNRSISIEMATSMGSHDTLQSIKSPSEHDALIKKSTSNLGTSST